MRSLTKETRKMKIKNSRAYCSHFANYQSCVVEIAWSNICSQCLKGNLARCSPLTPNFLGGLGFYRGFYLTWIDCWRSDSSYLSVVFEKNCSKNRNWSIFCLFSPLCLTRIPSTVPILKNYIFRQSTGRKALPEVEGLSPTPFASAKNCTVSVAGPFVNFDSGFGDLDWLELSSHQDFTFDRMTL